MKYIASTVTAREKTPIAGSPNRFLRLKVSRP